MSDIPPNELGSTPEGLPPVLVLAGGQGTRLRSMVPDRPKVLAEVAGRPFLCWWFSVLISQGVRQATLCTGYMADRIRARFGDSWGPMEIEYSEEQIPLGTGGALSLAASRINSEWVLVLNGDSFCELDIREFWRRHLQRGAAATIAVTKVPDTRRFGRIELKPDGRITGFLEKNSTRGDGWINAGVYILPVRLLTQSSPSSFCSLERDVVPLLIGNGLHGDPRTGRFIDIGTPETFQEAQTFFHPVGSGTEL